MDMIICKQCQVELAPWMDACPLCGLAVADGERPANPDHQPHERDRQNQGLLKRIFLQITCVLLLSGILATLVINLAQIGRVTWSVYPITICVIVLSYAFLMGTWNTSLTRQILGGWVISAAALIIVHFYEPNDWPLKLALPILSSVNVVVITLALIVANLKKRGLNIVAILFIGAAILCLLTEVTLSWYLEGEVRLNWSVVVSACLLPVTAVIIFMHFKTRNNADLQKVFHT